MTIPLPRASYTRVEYEALVRLFKNLAEDKGIKTRDIARGKSLDEVPNEDSEDDEATLGRDKVNMGWKVKRKCKS